MKRVFRKEVFGFEIGKKDDANRYWYYYAWNKNKTKYISYVADLSISFQDDKKIKRLLLEQVEK